MLKPTLGTIDAHGAPPTLLVSGLHDAVTNHDEGKDLAARLGNGSFLFTYEGDGHVSSTRSQCVRDVVTAFLVDPSVKPGRDSCPAE